MIYSRKLLISLLPNIAEVTDDEMITACGSIGTEIENIYKHPKLNNLVIGKLLSFEKHPNADKLNVCKVQINQAGTIHTIVCGASNLVAEKNVIVALEGAKLFDGRVIDYRELRGVRSEGMLCGYYELTPYNEGFVSSKDDEGIMLFDDGTIGDKNVAEFLGLNDTIYDISVPFANRNDLNGALSICQELSGYFGWNFKYPTLKTSSFQNKINLRTSVDSSICSGVALTKINNISTEQSPWKLKSILMNNGIKPLNNLLDKLNYITLLTNVPSAAYDADKLSEIKIELANDRDLFDGFDGKQYTLNHEDIVIKNNNNDVICLAGILGANKYGIDKETKNVIVEFAHFDFKRIRETAIRLNITTDAARRFSKKSTTFSAFLAAQLIYKFFKKEQIVGTKIIGHIEPKHIIGGDLSVISKIIGSNLSYSQIKNKVAHFGFKPTLTKGFIIPPYRTDIISVQDLSEELTKSLKVNEIPEETIDTSGEIENKYTEYYFTHAIKNLLARNYFSETKTYNTTNSSTLKTFNIFNYAEHVKIISSHNANREYLRSNLIHGMLSVYKHNVSYKNKLIPIFEIQKIYNSNKSGELNLTLLTEETYMIDKINNSKVVYNLNGLKGICIQVARLFGTNLSFNPTDNVSAFYGNETVEILSGSQSIGYIGCIKNQLLSPFNLEGRKIYCLSLNLNTLFGTFVETPIKFVKPNSLMPIIKDLTITSDGSILLDNAVNKIKWLDFVESFEFIDKYQKDNVAKYTIRLYLKNYKDIKSEDIDKNMASIIAIFNDSGFQI